MLWEAVFLLLILKIPIVYLCLVVWWAIRAEPREEEGDMFLHNPMNFSVRRRMLKYGYESAARLLKEQREVYEVAFGRHQVRVDADQLQPPWELTG